MRYVLTCIALLAISIIACASKENNQNQDLKKSMERGSVIYKDFCIVCHGANGEGVENTFPPLAQSDYLMTKRTESIKAIKFGQKGEIIVNGKTYNNAMAPLGLYDDEIADVMNYINNSWGNKNTEIVTPEEVSKLKE